MNAETLQKIFKLSHNRIDYLSHLRGWTFYKGYQTFLDGMRDEIQETEEEIQSGRKIYLEDELWDVFWDYICLLCSLQDEWRIETEKVFERCYQKFSERLNQDGSDSGNWQQIKNSQKAELEKEYLNSL